MTPDTMDVEPGQAWTVDAFHPADARGVVALFHSVYGDNYPVPTYLDPDLLVKENREGAVISSVARLLSGAIVGHVSLFNSAPNPRIFESGAGLVHTLYRGGQGIFTRMVAHGIEMGRKNPDVDLIYGEPVCNHPFSQKMLIGQGFVSCAMEINLMPAAAYAREGSARGRVSTLLDFMPVKPEPCTVFVPKGYGDYFKFCYSNLDEDRTFEAAKRTQEVRESRIDIQTFDFAGVARIAVPDAGQDFNARMEGEEKNLIRKGFRVIQVWLNSGQPQVGRAADCLKNLGYFFGGVLPRWFGTDGLLMQKVLDEPDWEGTVLVGQRNETLAALVREEWESRQK